MKYKFDNFSLLQSVYNVSQLKYYALPQVVMFGRSNVGKSSLINSLCKQKSLAKTSKTPGLTQSINFYATEKQNFLLVDLPGYGFAKTNKLDKQKWEKLLLKYLSENEHLKRAFILIDSRRGLMQSDEMMIDLCREFNVSYQIILTKTDKLKKLELDEKIVYIANHLKNDKLFNQPIFITSHLKRIGIEDLRKYISKVLNNGSD